MKSTYGRINVLLVIFYILGVIFTLVSLYSLPRDIALTSGQLDFEAINEIKPLVVRSGIIIGVTSLFGLGAIILSLLLVTKTEGKEKIVYVERSQKDEKRKKAEESDRKDIQIDENALLKIKERLAAVKNQEEKFQAMLSAVGKETEICQGAVYLPASDKGKRMVKLVSSYAFSLADSESIEYEYGEGLVGQAAKEKKKMLISDVPDGYLKVISGLGSASPTELLILPVLSAKKEILAVVEFASFKKLTSGQLELVEQILRLPEMGLEQAPAEEKKAEKGKKE